MPRIGWPGYRLLFLPNVTLTNDETRKRIELALNKNPETHLVAKGGFDMYSGDGQFNYRPPERLADRFSVWMADSSAVTVYDIKDERKVIQTPYGPVRITLPCAHAVLQPCGNIQSITPLEDETIVVRDADGRFTWHGLTFSSGFGDVGNPDLVLELTEEFGICPHASVAGDAVVPLARKSCCGGWLLFVFNVERR